MTDRLSIRVTSFVLAASVTLSVFAGIDTLAQGQHAGGLQMSQAKPASPVAVACTAAAVGS